MLKHLRAALRFTTAVSTGGALHDNNESLLCAIKLRGKKSRSSCARCSVHFTGRWKAPGTMTRMRRTTLTPDVTQYVGHGRSRSFRTRRYGAKYRNNDSRIMASEPAGCMPSRIWEVLSVAPFNSLRKLRGGHEGNRGGRAVRSASGLRARS